MDFDDMRPRDGDDDPRETDLIADDRADRREARRQQTVIGTWTARASDVRVFPYRRVEPLK